MADGRLKRDGIVLNAGRRFAGRDRRSHDKMGSRKRAFPSWAGIGILEGHSSGTAQCIYKRQEPVATGYFQGGEGRSVKFDGHLQPSVKGRLALGWYRSLCMSMQLSCEVVCPASRCRISNFACLEFVWAAEEVDFEINFKVNFKLNFEVNFQVNFQVNFKVNFQVNNFQVNFQVNVEANVLCSSIKNSRDIRM